MDLESYLRDLSALTDINIDAPELPKINNMLIWHALAVAEVCLDDYNSQAPSQDKALLLTALSLIKDCKESTRKALSVYQQLFEVIEQWLTQSKLNHEQTDKTAMLLKTLAYVLQALPHDCEQISWPLSSWIPANIYTESQRLLELTHVRFEDLKQRKALHPSPHASNSFNELKQLIDKGLSHFHQTIESIAEKKEEYLFLLGKFNQLQTCLINKEPQEIMQAFWLQYSDEESFKDLMDVLLLTENEKNAWLKSYSIYRASEPKLQSWLSSVGGALGKVGHYTAYLFKGASLTPAVLEERLYQAASALYQQVIPKPLRVEQKNEWLNQMQQALAQAQTNTVIYQLKQIRQALQLGLPSQAIALDNDQQQTEEALLKAAHTAQFRINDVWQVRRLLSHLYQSTVEMRAKLKINQQKVTYVIELLNSLQQLTSTKDFQLTQLSAADINGLVDAVQQMLLMQFKSILPSAEQLDDSLTIEQLYQTADQQLAKRIETFRDQLQRFNDKGESVRQDALQQLRQALLQYQGFWERCFRFFSSQYRVCMAQVESIERSQASSFDKVNQISALLQQTQQHSFFLVANRLENYINCDRYGMFSYSGETPASCSV